jgi:predicted nucleic acid-binding protein
MLVIDANVAVGACAGPNGFQAIGAPSEDLAAPPLMWSEARATLRLKNWTGEITTETANTMLKRLQDAPVEKRDPAQLGSEAWNIAVEFGWGRTYDAEYLALAKILGCRLVTIDGRLYRGAARLGIVITPDELKPKPDPPADEEP